MSPPIVLKIVLTAYGYFVSTPAVVMRPTKPFPVNQIAPSGPDVIPQPLVLTGKGNSVTTPAVVMRPILLPDGPNTVNHKAPSGPAVMPVGALSPASNLYSVITPDVVIRPIWAGL